MGVGAPVCCVSSLSCFSCVGSALLLLWSVLVFSCGEEDLEVSWASLLRFLFSSIQASGLPFGMALCWRGVGEVKCLIGVLGLCYGHC